MTINIQKRDVFRQVARMTAYMGVKNDHPEMVYDRVAVVEADQALLENFFTASRLKVERLLAEYLLQPTSTEDGHYTLCLSLPDPVDEQMRQALQTAIYGCFVTDIIAQWVALTLPDALPHEEGNAQRQWELLAAMVHDRRRPERPVCELTASEPSDRAAHSFTVYRDYLLYEIANNAYAMAHGKDRTQHERHQIMDMTKDQNLDRILSTLQLAYRQLCDILSPFLDVDTPSSDTVDYVFTLRRAYAPWERHGGRLGVNTLHYWRILAQEYMTAAALADWLSLIHPPLAAYWQSRQEDVRQQLVVSLTVRKQKPKKRMEVV